MQGLQRIYLDSENEIATLLSNDLTITKKRIPVHSRNQRVTICEHEDTACVLVKDVLLSADGQILIALEQYNCVVLNHFRERL